MLSTKTSSAAKLFNAVHKAQVSWKRIKPLMHEPKEPAEAEAAKPDPLQVRHLSFAYSGGKDIIHNLSFDAKPGQIIGITGPVACGKSTLGKAFLCEYRYAGDIRYGGRELSRMDPTRRTVLWAIWAMIQSCLTTAFEITFSWVTISWTPGNISGMFAWTKRLPPWRTGSKRW